MDSFSDFRDIAAVHSRNTSSVSEFVNSTHSSDTLADEDRFIIITVSSVKGNREKVSTNGSFREKSFFAVRVNPLDINDMAVNVVKRHCEAVSFLIKSEAVGINLLLAQVRVRVVLLKEYEGFEHNASLLTSNARVLFKLLL